jgi:hypothetical protein
LRYNLTIYQHIQNEAAMTLSPVYDDLLDFLIAKATPEEILAFQPSQAAEARAIELLERSSVGDLTMEEIQELEQMRQVDRLVSVLKARALETLSRS